MFIVSFTLLNSEELESSVDLSVDLLTVNMRGEESSMYVNKLLCECQAEAAPVRECSSNCSFISIVK